MGAFCIPEPLPYERSPKTPTEEWSTISIEGLPLAVGAEGETVRDLHVRLARAGFAGAPEHSVFTEDTKRLVLEFQISRGLHQDGIVGRETWQALDEASHRLGDRLLYEQKPMGRGDDVSELQRRLGGLGFDAGRVDGIFGPDTASALGDFQRNAGLKVDRICGPDSIAQLLRLGSRSGPEGVATLRESERLRQRSDRLETARIVIGERGGLSSLTDRLGKNLSRAGAQVLVLHQPDGSEQAKAANEFDADVYLGLRLEPEDLCSMAYFGTDGFVSYGGRRLATLTADALGLTLRDKRGEALPMRLPVLRETRMPAVLGRIGPPRLVEQYRLDLLTILQTTLSTWLVDPVEPV